MVGESVRQKTPYLTLSVPQALSLPDPPLPEKREYINVLDLFEHRAKHQSDVIAAGFAEPRSDREGSWRCTTLSEHMHWTA